MTSTSRHRRPDSGADYNAFGRDPQGRIAYLCALFFGPNYIPLVPASQFGGRVVPPRYGPPAHYQRACLPQDFVVQSPPNYDADLPDLARMDSSWFLEPPKIFDPSAFNAVVCLAVFLRGNQGEPMKHNVGMH